MKHLVILALLLGAAYKFWIDRPVPLNTNVRADFPPHASAPVSLRRAPYQRSINPKRRAYQHENYLITPLAEFQVEARVLGTTSYSNDREAELSPIDLALGWGPMADPAVIGQIDISQSGRWYRWHVEQWPIPREAIERNSANMHFIPGNPAVASKLESVAEGDVVRFKGYLVEVSADDGWRWVSSLTRDDVGARACEVILVEDLVRL